MMKFLGGVIAVVAFVAVNVALVVGIVWLVKVLVF